MRNVLRVLIINCKTVPRYCEITLKQLAVLQSIIKKSLVTIFFKISLQIYIIVVRNKNTYIFSLFFALKTDSSLFCNRDIPTIPNATELRGQ